MLRKDLVKLKDIRCDVLDVLWRCLKKRKAADGLLVIPIDGFRTSRICSKCYTNSFDAVRSIKGQNFLACKIYNTLWQIDMNTLKNMVVISFCLGRQRWTFPF